MKMFLLTATCGGGGISPTFGAALWIMDYSLQAALNGVERLYFHQGLVTFNAFVCLQPSDMLFDRNYCELCILLVGTVSQPCQICKKRRADAFTIQEYCKWSILWRSFPVGSIETRWQESSNAGHRDQCHCCLRCLFLHWNPTARSHHQH